MVETGPDLGLRNPPRTHVSWLTLAETQHQVASTWPTAEAVFFFERTAILVSENVKQSAVEGRYRKARRGTLGEAHRRPGIGGAGALPSFALSQAAMAVAAVSMPIASRPRLAAITACSPVPHPELGPIAGPFRHSRGKPAGASMSKGGFPRRTHQNPPVASAAASSATSHNPWDLSDKYQVTGC